MIFKTDPSIQALFKAFLRIFKTDLNIQLLFRAFLRFSLKILIFKHFSRHLKDFQERS